MIVKQRNRFIVKSKSGRRLSKPLKSRKAAMKRLRQVEFFKHRRR